MSNTAQLIGAPALLRLVRATLWFIFGVAVIVAIATAVGGIVTLVTELGSGTIQLTLVAGKHPPTVSEGSASHRFIVTSSYPSAELTLHGMSAAVTAFSVVSDVALVLTELTLSLLVALLAWRLLRGRVFRRSVSITVTAAGLVLVIGGLLSQAGNALGGALAASELNGGGRGFWPLAGRFDPTLMVIGFVLLLVGLAFEYGERLQKETDGLV